MKALLTGTAVTLGLSFSAANASPFCIGNFCVVDPDKEIIIEPFIGDYAYCNTTYTEGVFNCRVIHNGIDQDLPNRPIAMQPASADEQPKAAGAPADEFAAPPTAAPPLVQPPAARKKIRDCVRAPMTGSCAR